MLACNSPCASIAIHLVHLPLYCYLIDRFMRNLTKIRNHSSEGTRCFGRKPWLKTLTFTPLIKYLFEMNSGSIHSIYLSSCMILVNLSGCKDLVFHALTIGTVWFWVLVLQWQAWIQGQIQGPLNECNVNVTVSSVWRMGDKVKDALLDSCLQWIWYDNL